MIPRTVHTGPKTPEKRVSPVPPYHYLTPSPLLYPMREPHQGKQVGHTGQRGTVGYRVGDTAWVQGMDTGHGWICRVVPYVQYPLDGPQSARMDDGYGLRGRNHVDTIERREKRLTDDERTDGHNQQDQHNHGTIPYTTSGCNDRDSTRKRREGPAKRPEGVRLLPNTGVRSETASTEDAGRGLRAVETGYYRIPSWGTDHPHLTRLVTTQP